MSFQARAQKPAIWPASLPDQQVRQFVDHLPQHAGAAIVEREDQVLADQAGFAVHVDQDAAERVRSGPGRCRSAWRAARTTWRVTTRVTFMIELH